jgi:hypothetical protein
MDKFLELLSEFFKKNRTLYFCILSLTTILFLNFINQGKFTVNPAILLKIPKEIDWVFLMISILLTSYTITRILVFVGFESFFLRFLIVSDLIFLFGKDRENYEEGLLIL